MISDEQLRQLVARELHISPEMLRSDTTLAALPGFDSVQLLMLIVALEEAGLKMPAAEAAHLRTFGDIVALDRR
jgi:acyl carrier protein